MKILLTSLLLLCAHLSHSQIIIDDIDINQDSTIRLCQIVASSKALSNKVYINIDYGQETKWIQGKGSYVKGENNKLINFNSVIDALNFFENNGWTLINSYTANVGGQNVYHHLFRKRE